MIGGTERDFDQLAAKGPLKTYANDMYALRAVKLYSDGALGSRGAALLAPYSDEPKSHGLLFSSDAAIRAMMAKGDEEGLPGQRPRDRRRRQPPDPRRLRAAGASRPPPAACATASSTRRWSRWPTSRASRRIGIIPSMQPTHATSDMNMAEQRVGAERIKGAYAWRTFLKQGSRIACGSDFPVESPNPFFGIHAAVTRQDAQSQPAAGWHADQAMTLKEAFRCFTLDAAFAAHQENTVGSLEAGKWADFIVIDRDLFKMPAADIHKTGVLQTWVAGRQVYQKK